jgi:hypothetical protein
MLPEAERIVEIRTELTDNAVEMDEESPILQKAVPYAEHVVLSNTFEVSSAELSSDISGAELAESVVPMDDDPPMLKIDAVFSLAPEESNTDMMAEIFETHKADSPDGSNKDKPISMEELYKTHCYSQEEMLSLCGSSFVVMERLSAGNLDEKGMPRVQSQCSGYCRDRTLKFLCMANLIRCPVRDKETTVETKQEIKKEHKLLGNKNDVSVANVSTQANSGEDFQENINSSSQMNKTDNGEKCEVKHKKLVSLLTGQMSPVSKETTTKSAPSVLGRPSKTSARTADLASVNPSSSSPSERTLLITGPLHVVPTTVSVPTSKAMTTSMSDNVQNFDTSAASRLNSFALQIVNEKVAGTASVAQKMTAFPSVVSSVAQTSAYRQAQTTLTSAVPTLVPTSTQAKVPSSSGTQAILVSVGAQSGNAQNLQFPSKLFIRPLSSSATSITPASTAASQQMFGMIVPSSEPGKQPTLLLLGGVKMSSASSTATTISNSGPLAAPFLSKPGVAPTQIGTNTKAATLLGANTAITMFPCTTTCSTFTQVTSTAPIRLVPVTLSTAGVSCIPMASTTSVGGLATLTKTATVPVTTTGLFKLVSPSPLNPLTGSSGVTSSARNAGIGMSDQLLISRSKAQMISGSQAQLVRWPLVSSTQPSQVATPSQPALASSRMVATKKPRISSIVQVTPPTALSLGTTSASLGKTVAATAVPAGVAGVSTGSVIHVMPDGSVRPVRATPGAPVMALTNNKNGENILKRLVSSTVKEPQVVKGQVTANQPITISSVMGKTMSQLKLAAIPVPEVGYVQQKQVMVKQGTRPGQLVATFVKSDGQSQNPMDPHGVDGNTKTVVMSSMPIISGPFGSIIPPSTSGQTSLESKGRQPGLPHQASVPGTNRLLSSLAVVTAPARSINSARVSQSAARSDTSTASIATVMSQISSSAAALAVSAQKRASAQKVTTASYTQPSNSSSIAVSNKTDEAAKKLSRQRLKEKYPLPPGVVIKVEPEPDFGCPTGPDISDDQDELEQTGQNTANDTPGLTVDSSATVTAEESTEKDDDDEDDDLPVMFDIPIPLEQSTYADTNLAACTTTSRSIRTGTDGNYDNEDEGDDEYGDMPVLELELPLQTEETDSYARNVTASTVGQPRMDLSRRVIRPTAETNKEVLQKLSRLAEKRLAGKPDHGEPNILRKRRRLGSKSDERSTSKIVASGETSESGKRLHSASESPSGAADKSEAPKSSVSTSSASEFSNQTPSTSTLSSSSHFPSLGSSWMPSPSSASSSERIQRLKEMLRKQNEQLENIRKQRAAQRPALDS